MARLELNVREAEVLRDTLESYISDLRMEIANTDAMDFRDQLKEREAVLRRIADALATPGAPAV